MQPGDRVVFTPDVEWPRWKGQRGMIVGLTEPTKLDPTVWVEVRRDADGRVFNVRPFEVRVLGLIERIGELDDGTDAAG